MTELIGEKAKAKAKAIQQEIEDYGLIAYIIPTTRAGQDRLINLILILVFMVWGFNLGGQVATGNALLMLEICGTTSINRSELTSQQYNPLNHLNQTEFINTSTTYLNHGDGNIQGR